MSLKSSWRNYRIRRHEKVLAKLKADSSSLDTNTRGHSPYYTGNKYADYSPLSLHPGSQATPSPNVDIVSQVEFHRSLGRIHEDIASLSLRLENLCLQLAGVQQQLNRQPNSSSFYGGPQPNYSEVFEATESEESRNLHGKIPTRASLPDQEPNLDHHRYGTVRTSHQQRGLSRDRALREMNNPPLAVTDKLNPQNMELESLYTSMYR